MIPEDIKQFLLLSTIINYGIVLVWFAVLAVARDGIFRLHTRWFSMPLETFNTIHYAAMAIYKIGILLFNLVPYTVLAIMY